MRNDLILLLITAGAVVGVGWYLTKKGGTVVSVGNKSGSPENTWSSEIANNALPGQSGWGWSYYSDGVAIGPDGTYYKNGVPVWRP